jgi:uncharacterized protein YgiB involved in biofilm formation
MENLKHSSERSKPQAQAREHAQHSLASEAWSLDQMVHSAENTVHGVEKWVGEHKAASTAIGAAATTAVVVGMLATKGELGKVVEGVTEIVDAGSKGSGLLGEATNLLSRSSTLRAAGIGTAVVPLAALAGCDNEPSEKVNIYKDANECTKGGVFTKGYCESEYAAAKKLHDQTAPKFKTKQECEDKTGDNCQADNGWTDASVSNGTNNSAAFIYYRPWMYGYVMNQSPASSVGSSYIGRTAPVYSSTADNELVTSHGDDLHTTKTNSESEISSSDLSRASKPMSSTEAETESETGAFARSARAVTTVAEGAGEVGVARGGFGGEGEAGGAHGGGVGE